MKSRKPGELHKNIMILLLSRWQRIQTITKIRIRLFRIGCWQYMMNNILAFGPYWRAESLVGTTISQMMILLSRWRRIQTSKNGCDFDTLTAFMAWQLCFFCILLYNPYKVIHRSTFHTRKYILGFPNRFNALLILHVNILILFITLTDSSKCWISNI